MVFLLNRLGCVEAGVRVYRTEIRKTKNKAPQPMAVLLPPAEALSNPQSLFSNP
jgi:hypothetical protein